MPFAFAVGHARSSRLAAHALAATMADRASLVIDDSHTELARRMPRACLRQVTDQGGVERPEAMRLTGPVGKPKQREQRERQVPAHRHAITAPLGAGRTGAGETWAATPGATSDSGIARAAGGTPDTGTAGALGIPPLR